MFDEEEEPERSGTEDSAEPGSGCTGVDWTHESHLSPGIKTNKPEKRQKLVPV